MDAIQYLEGNFRAFGFPEAASKWLLDLWRVIQAWDDVADGDKIEREDLDRAIWLSLCGMPSNPFFLEHQYLLLPVVGNAALKWKASDTIERGRMVEHYPKAYMWRAGFYDVVLHVYEIVHGYDKAMADAHKIMTLYGETYADYSKEFQNA